MNNDFKLFFKFINKLCIVYLFVFVFMMFFLILNEGFNDFDFSIKKFIFVLGIPISVFFLTKFLVKE
jgi:hypothetical protein